MGYAIDHDVIGMGDQFSGVCFASFAVAFRKLFQRLRLVFDAVAQFFRCGGIVSGDVTGVFQ